MFNVSQLFSIIAVVLALSVSITQADDGWVTISENKLGQKWQAKKGSFEFAKNKAGKPIAVVIGRYTATGANSIMLGKWYVSLEDCINSHGTIVTLSMSGEFKYESDFVYDGGTVACGMAEFICEVARQIVIDADAKGI